MNRKQKLALALALLTLPAQATAQWSLESLSSGKYSAATASVGKYLLVAGGSDGNSASHLDTVDVYDAQTRTWSVDHLSSPRSGLAATSWAGRAYFAGGRDASGQLSDTIDVFDSVTGSWSILTLPTARVNHAAGAANGILMFACGTDSSSVTASVDLYDIANGTWSSTSIDGPRILCSVAAIGDELVIAGGIGFPFGQAVPTISIYNTLTQTWRTEFAPLTPVTGPVAVSGGKAYYPSSLLPLIHPVQVYDGATQTWSVLSLPNPRGAVEVVSLGTQIVFAGGAVNGMNSNIVDVYDSLSGTWTSTTLPGVVRQSMSGSIYGRAIFAGGGHNVGFQFPTFSEVHVYEPDVGSSFCGPAVLNSTGVAATIRARGSMRAGGEPLALVAENMPANQFSLFLAGRILSQSPIIGSNGILCLGAPFGPFANDLTQTSAAGVTSISIDTEALPLLGGTAAMSGETWYFQAWFREPAGSSNLSDAVGVTFN